MSDRFTAYLMPASNDTGAIEFPIELMEDGRILYFEGSRTEAQRAFDEYADVNKIVRDRVCVIKMTDGITGEYIQLKTNIEKVQI